MGPLEKTKIAGGLKLRVSTGVSTALKGEPPNLLPKPDDFRLRVYTVQNTGWIRANLERVG